MNLASSPLQKTRLQYRCSILRRFILSNVHNNQFNQALSGSGDTNAARLRLLKNQLKEKPLNGTLNALILND